MLKNWLVSISMGKKILFALLIVSMLTNVGVVSATPLNSQSEPQVPELLDLAPYVTINEDGLFVLDRTHASSSLEVSERTLEWVSEDLSRLNQHLRELPREERPYVVESRTGDAQIEWSMDHFRGGDQQINACVHVPRWVFDTIGWTAIIYGGGLVTAGLFAEGTIIGIPLGVLLQAIGLWDGIAGSFLLWYVAEYYPDGAYVCW